MYFWHNNTKTTGTIGTLESGFNERPRKYPRSTNETHDPHLCIRWNSLNGAGRESTRNGASPANMARVTGSEARVKSSEARVKSSEARVTSSVARVTSSEARVTSSEINYAVLVFKMAAILTKNSAIIRSNIVSFCGNSASFKLKLTDIN